MIACVLAPSLRGAVDTGSHAEMCWVGGAATHVVGAHTVGHHRVWSRPLPEMCEGHVSAPALREVVEESVGFGRVQGLVGRRRA